MSLSLKESVAVTLEQGHHLLQNGIFSKNFERISPAEIGARKAMCVFKNHLLTIDQMRYRFHKEHPVAARLGVMAMPFIDIYKRSVEFFFSVTAFGAFITKLFSGHITAHDFKNLFLIFFTFLVKLLLLPLQIIVDILTGIVGGKVFELATNYEAYFDLCLSQKKEKIRADL